MIRKICHLTSVHGRYDNRIFFKECCSLASNGWEVHLVVADGKGDERLHGVSIWDVGFESGRFGRFFKSAKRVYKKGLEIDANIYHFHDPDLIPFGLKLKKRNKKVFYDVHEDYRTQILIKPWIHSYLRKVISFFFGKYENYAMKRFDGLLVPQAGMVHYFSHLNKNTIFVANSIIIDGKFDLDQKDYSNKICFHPGTLSKERGVLNMINAFEFLVDDKLILAGSFESKKLHEKAKTSKGWSKVNFMGKRPYSEIKEFHKEASIGLILFENVGQYHFAYTVKLFEYMYFGTPVLMPNFGDWVEFNKKYQCGINIDPDDPEKIAETINYLNNNPSVKKELGENGRKAVVEELNWNTDKMRLLGMYNSILLN